MSYPELPDQTGKAPKHREAALKTQAKDAMNVPMAKQHQKVAKLYHGTASSFSNFNKELIGKGVGGNLEGKGVYLTDKIWSAEYFAKEAMLASGKVGKGMILEAVPKKPLNIIDLEKDKISSDIGKSILQKAGIREDTIQSFSKQDLSDPKVIVDISRYGKNYDFMARGYYKMFEDIGYDAVMFTEEGSDEFRKSSDKAKTLFVFNPLNIEFKEPA